ncbi:MAG TPA: M48 family metallopeptidase [Cytophagaceae bacterium]
MEVINSQNDNNIKNRGVYFTGKSSVSVPVHVTVTPFYFILEPCDGSGGTIQWKHEEVLSFEENSHKTIVKFGTAFPCPMLVVESESLKKDIRRLKPNASYLKPSPNILMSNAVKGLLIAVTVVIAMLVFAYVYVIPVLMEKLASVVPVSLEKQVGDSFKQSFLMNQQIDSARTIAINKFYSELKVPGSYPINITVVESDVQNAFALPGGEIVVFNGIIDNMQSYPELVALLGHEAGHIEKRHSLKLLMKNMANYLILSAILQDFNSIMAAIIENAASLEELSYNREKEEESDEFGYAVLRENKIDPNGMVRLFEQLQQGDGSRHTPEFLQTHPKLDNRIKTIKEKIKKEVFPVEHHPNLKNLFDEIKKANSF